VSDATDIDRLVALLQRHQIDGVSRLIDAFRHNDEFSSDWKKVWRDIAEADGGKISLTTTGAILGAVLGGVGIAAGGGAIGFPLALVLGLGGLLAGSEFDSIRSLSRTKFHLLRLPIPLYARISEAARAAGISENDLIVKVLGGSFPDPAVLN
jgi:hypothetical protein